MNAPSAAAALGALSGRVHILGDDINTDVHCSSKYLPGRDSAYAAQRAFEQLVPGFAARFKAGDLIVAGRHFGINSSREQAIQVLRLLGVSAIVAVSFGRQFYRNAINNGLPVAECGVGGIADGDLAELDLAAGRFAVPARGIVEKLAPLPESIRALLAAGGLIPFLQQHPDWKVPGDPRESVKA